MGYMLLLKIKPLPHKNEPTTTHKKLTSLKMCVMMMRWY